MAAGIEGQTGIDNVLFYRGEEIIKCARGRKASDWRVVEFVDTAEVLARRPQSAGYITAREG